MEKASKHPLESDFEFININKESSLTQCFKEEDHKENSKEKKTEEQEDESNSNINKIHSKTEDFKIDQSKSILHEDYEAVAPIDQKLCSVVLSVAMRKDYEETIMNNLIDISNHEEDLPGFGDYPYFRVNQALKFIPRTDVVSEILSEKQLKELHLNFPYYHQNKNLRLVFSPTKHGISMKTFYLKTDDIKQTIIVIKDDNQHVFGGFLSENIRNSQKFYGTGESFVFTFHNSERIHAFQATMENEFFIYSDNEIIAMGCDDNNNFSFVIRDEFLKGHSRTTKTFQNPVLAANDIFFIDKMEVWAFVE